MSDQSKGEQGTVRHPVLTCMTGPKSIGWVDVERFFTQGSSDGYWTIELAAKPPPAAGLEPGLLIAYGLCWARPLTVLPTI